VVALVEETQVLLLVVLVVEEPLVSLAPLILVAAVEDHSVVLRVPLVVPAS
jgi:hypothetical protein